ncbi:MAG: hypothetical protein K0S70_661 [Microbacterium sp.]|jgi:hypothetical protein|nr:hypothetical protein [Microbacterium sp.]
MRDVLGDSWRELLVEGERTLLMHQERPAVADGFARWEVRSKFAIRGEETGEHLRFPVERG